MPEDKKRVVIPNLESLGKMLGVVDEHILSTFSTRMKLASLVEKHKRLEKDMDPIVRLSKEDERIGDMGKLAQKYHINEHFARMVEYQLINESCKLQLYNREGNLDADEERLYLEDQASWLAHLRKNLIQLTSEVAPTYDVAYGQDAPIATKSYLEHEQKVIRQEILALDALGKHDLAVDLGCATGNMSFKLSQCFKDVVGIDISQSMVDIAKGKNNISIFPLRIKFQVSDFEQAIQSIRDASFIIANLGTASEVTNTRLFLGRVSEALCRDGRFVFSFYNRNALHQQIFLPWNRPLRAEIDTIRHFLSVEVPIKEKLENKEKPDDTKVSVAPTTEENPGKESLKDTESIATPKIQFKVFQIFAQAYSVQEIKTMFEPFSQLCISRIETHPTVCSVLPNESLAGAKAQELVRTIDNQLLKQGLGTYIIVTGRKT